MTDRTTLLVAQSDITCPPARVGRWLQERDLDLHVVRSFEGADLPDTLDGFDGLMILGGAMGSMDDHVAPWLPHLRDLTKQAVDSDLPVLGLCLGLQILASACGGEVSLGGVPEFGLGTIELTDAGVGDPVTGVLPPTVEIPQFHRDGVSVTPPGAVVLASSPLYEVQVMRMGRYTYATQGHPEIDGEILRSWVGFEEADILEGSGADPDASVAELTAAEDRLERHWRPMFHAWADLVRERASTL